MASAVYKICEPGEGTLTSPNEGNVGLSPVHSEMRCMEVVEPCALGNAMHFLVHLASPNKDNKKSSLPSKLGGLHFLSSLLGLNPEKLQIQDTEQHMIRNRYMYQDR